MPEDFNGAENRWAFIWVPQFPLSTDQVKRVIYDGPATVVFWKDGTKTVVKLADGDRPDREKGLAMACAKKLFGNKGSYRKVFDKHLYGGEDV